MIRMIKIAILALAVCNMNLATPKEDADKVYSLGLYVTPSYYKNPSIMAPPLHLRTISDRLIIPDLKMYLEAEGTKKLAEATDYDTDLEVEFKVNELDFVLKMLCIYDYHEIAGLPSPSGLSESLRKEKEEYRKIASLLKIQRKRSTFQWGISRKLFGHDWFEVRGPEITVKMDHRSLGAAEPLPDEKITIRGFFCRYGPEGRTISFPSNLIYLNNLLDNQSIFIDADYYDYKKGSKTIAIQISRNNSGEWQLKVNSLL